MANAPTVELRSVGDAAIAIGDARLDPSAEILFATSLYVVINRQSRISREELQQILWPRVSQPLRAHRLRQTLLKLKQVGFSLSTSSKTRVSLNGQDVCLDFESLLASPDESTLISLDSVRILPGYAPRFSEPYAEWVDIARSRIEARIANLLLELIAKYRAQGDWERVLNYAGKLLDLQSYNEDATLAFAEALALSGRKPDALAALDAFINEEGSSASYLCKKAVSLRKRIAAGVSTTDSSPREAAFVGRSSTMEQLIQWLEQALNASGRACFVWGDAGVGKTRVLTELTSVASLRGMTTLRHHCRPSDRHRPLSVICDLVPRLLSLRGAIGCSPETLLYLEKLTRARRITEGFELGDDSSETTYGRIHRALFDLLDAVSEDSAIMIVVEDAHWMDVSSARLTADIAIWMADRRMMLAISSRKSSADAGMDDVVRSVHLGPLSPEHAVQLVKALISERGIDIPAQYLEWCVTVTEGNPYFLQELTRQWAETQTELKIPTSLTALITQRLARLESDSVYLLQAIAALDQNSSLARIERVLEWDTTRLLRGLVALENAGMLNMKQGNPPISGSNIVTPKHDVLADVALSLLPEAAKAYLHRRVATVLEAHIADTVSTALLWDCVRHWQRAGDGQHALSLATLCADHLMEVGLPYAAAEAYEKVLSFCISDDERIKLLPSLAHAYYRSSSWRKVGDTVAEFDRLRARLGVHSFTHDEFELMNLRAEWRTLQWTRTIDKALNCLHAVDATPNHRVEAGVMALMLMDNCCDHDGMREVFDKIDTIAKDASVKPSLLMQAQMVYHTACGDLKIGLAAAADLVGEERKNGNIGDLIRSLCNYGQTARAAGSFELAGSSFREALAIAKENGILPAIGRVVPLLASMALELGHHDEAREWCRVLSELPQTDDKYFALDVQAIEARLALVDGDGQRAAKLLSHVLIEPKDDPVAYRRTYQAALEVATQLACSGRAKTDSLEALRTSHMQSRVGYHQAFAAFVLLTGLRSVGRAAEGEQIIDEYVRHYRREPWPPPMHLLERLEAARQLAS